MLAGRLEGKAKEAIADDDATEQLQTVRRFMQQGGGDQAQRHRVPL